MNSSTQLSSTDQDVMNTINILLNNTKDDGTKNIILRFLHVMAYTLNEMRDDLPKIKGIHTEVGSELIALFVTEALKREINIPDDLFKQI